MEASTASESKTQQVLHEADIYVRENPVPAVLYAVGIGFALGLLVRALDRPSAADLLEERAHSARGYLGSFLSPIARETKRAYRKSAHAVHDAVDSVSDLDVEDYTDPVVSWFNHLWKRIAR